MIEPIGWLRTLQFVAIDACVREDECVRAPLLFVVTQSTSVCGWHQPRELEMVHARSPER